MTLKKGNGAISYMSSDKKIIAVSKSGKATIKGTGQEENEGHMEDR